MGDSTLLITTAVFAGICLTITALYFLLTVCRPAAHQPPAAPAKSTAEQVKKVLSTIPLVNYTKTEKILPLNQSDCSVCLSSVEEGDKVRVLPDCGHAFHVLCIDAWLCKRLSCPCCRSPVNSPANSSVMEEEDASPV